MTPKSQRIAIAEACPNVIRILNQYGNNHWEYKSSVTGQWESCINNDPLNDLNAMHEAEKVLTLNQHYDYTGRLEKTVDGFCATAAQRAKAFLQTLDLWEDSPAERVNEVQEALTV